MEFLKFSMSPVHASRVLTNASCIEYLHSSSQHTAGSHVSMQFIVIFSNTSYILVFFFVNTFLPLPIPLNIARLS